MFVCGLLNVNGAPPEADQGVCAASMRSAASIRSTYDGEFFGQLPGAMLTLAIRRFGPYALVEARAPGGEGHTSMFHKRGARWCRTSNGPPTGMRESDMVGFDGIDRATARRVFRARPSVESAYVR